MKRTLLAASLLAFSGAAFAQDPPAAAPTSMPAPAADQMKAAARPDLGDAAAGEVIYYRYCAACHGKSLKGDGPVAPGLVKKPDDLTRMASKNGGVFPYDKVAASIDGRQTTRMHGSPDMPVWGEVFAISSGTDASDAATAVKRITHYVWANQKKAAAETAK